MSNPNNIITAISNAAVEKALMKLAEQHTNWYDAILLHIKDVIAKLQSIANRITGKDGKAQSETKELQEIHRRLVQLKDTVKQKSAANSDGKVQYSAADYNLPIVKSDVDVLRSIGRKSINSFTSEDIEKSAKWAYKFLKELGVKSPFFRAWFGDWRAQDKNAVKIVYAKNNTGKNPRGIFVNHDTGWKINSSSIGYDETVSHAGRNKTSLRMAQNIDRIIENSILFDTEVSEYGRGKKATIQLLYISSILL